MTSENEEKDLPSIGTGNSVARPKVWLVAYVHLYHEKKISKKLTADGIENFLPVQVEIRQWSDRRKKVERILIPMVIFVRVDMKERSQVLSLASVSRYMVLHGEHTPAVIPDEQMNRFKFMLDHSEEAIQFNNTQFAVGEKIRVIKGPLTGLEGELATIEGKTKVVVRIEILGCASIEISRGYIERIKQK